MTGANTTDLEMFHDPPPTVKDPNQAFLREVLDNFHKEDPGHWKISLRGFPASCVDLGWLTERARQWWLEHDATPRELCERLTKELPEVIQRLKKWDFDEDGDEHIDVEFQTKDDRGWYGYRFGIYLGPPDKDEEDVPDDEDESMENVA